MKLSLKSQINRNQVNNDFVDYHYFCILFEGLKPKMEFHLFHSLTIVYIFLVFCCSICSLSPHLQTEKHFFSTISPGIIKQPRYLFDKSSFPRKFPLCFFEMFPFHMQYKHFSSTVLIFPTLIFMTLLIRHIFMN